MLAVVALLVSAMIGGAAYAKFGLTHARATLIYLLSGLIGGGLVGLFLPFVTNSIRAAVVAAVAFIPLIAMIRIAHYGFSELTIGEFIGEILGVLLLGAIWGPLLWRARPNRPRAPSARP